MQDSNVYVIDGEAGRGRGEGTGEQQGRNGAQYGNTGRGAARAGAYRGWPRLAASLSMVISGSGHLLHRRWRTGVLYLIVAGLAVGLHALLATAWPRMSALGARYGAGEVDLLFALLISDLFVIAVLLAGVYTAYTLGRACCGELGEPTPHPAWPALASLLVPGWGQIVNGQALKALAFLSATYAAVFATGAWWAIPGPVERLVSATTAPLQPLLVVSGLVALAMFAWVLSLYDAVLVARYRRRASTLRRRSAPSSGRGGSRAPRRAASAALAARRSAMSPSGHMAVATPVGTPRRRAAARARR